MKIYVAITQDQHGKLEVWNVSTTLNDAIKSKPKVEIQVWANGEVIEVLAPNGELRCSMEDVEEENP